MRKAYRRVGATKPKGCPRSVCARKSPPEASGVKQHLAAVRMLFDWLVIGQVVPMNPAAAVRGRKHTSRPARRRCSTVTNGVGCLIQFRP